MSSIDKIHPNTQQWRVSVSTDFDEDHKVPLGYITLGNAEESDVVRVAAFVGTVDGAIVVQVDTEPSVDLRVRVNVNEGPVYDAIPETGETFPLT